MHDTLSPSRMNAMIDIKLQLVTITIGKYRISDI